ncbi:uncharacterized protein LOC130115912 [Lampris incognitus]|uniref:uncharacterized protein LOC130115912 n=1 Tax=Lampris incognitus TaxID=2546036 RepID=UPI0024B5DC61|nr:uncharacterized protein LOC130115912 [Lampris incognitus]
MIKFSQYIAERLGADINSDVSWTSSLNTPVSTTLILNRAEDRPCPVSPIAGKHVFTVRKLFPSLSNTSRIADPSLEKSDEPTIQQAVDCLHPGHSRRSLDPLQSPLDQNDSSWRQTLPDATGNGEICITEASVLAGTENVPSIFFTKSSSTLRRVKTKDRIKRKQNILTKEKNDCSLNVTTKNVDSGGRIGDEEHREVPSSPHIGSKDNTEDTAVTHWSPLRSSNISQCDLETSCNVYDPTKRLEPNLKTDQPTCEGDPHQLSSPSVKISDSTFTKKTRFVYTIESPSPRLNGKNMLTENLQSILNPVSGQECNVKQSEKASDEVQRHHVNEKMCNRGNKSSQQGNGAEKTQVSSLPSEGQDLDMSQLCRAFAQDITQISDVSTSEEHTAEDFFSPSVCLSAMKQRNKKLLNKQKSFQRVTNLQLDCNVISNKGHVTAPQPKSSNLESTVSGFQSTAVVTHVTSSSPVLSTEKDTESKPSSDCKTEISEVTLLQMSTKDKGSTHLNDIMEENVADVYLSSSIGKQSQMLGPGAGSNPYLEKTPKAPHPPVSATAIVNGKRAEHNSRVHIGDPQQITVHSPSLCVSGLDSLDKTKCLLKEIGGESPLGAQQAKCIRNTKKDTGMTHDKSAENMLTNLTNPHSSKEGGDVQCTLTASQQADVTELCRFLEEAGSEFLLTQFKPEKPKLQSPDTIPHPQGVDKELDHDFLTVADFDDSFSTDAGEQLAEMMASDKMTLPPQNNKNSKTPTNINSFAKNGHPETHNKLEGKKEFISDIGFKTAGGDALRVSENCLTKARASFADLEECPVNFSDKPRKTLPDKQRAIGQLSNNSGFCTAKGKRVSMSKDALKKARSLWKEFDAFEDNKQKNESLGPSHPTNPNLCPPRQNEGFKTASGKGVAISVTALQKGKALFSNCDIDENKKGVTTHPKFPFHQTSPVAFSAEPSQKGVSVFMDINTEIPVAAEVKDRILMDVEPGDAQNNREIIGCTFQTTRGIEVHVLERNLLKTKKLLNELPDGEYANSPTTLRPYSGRSFDVNRSDLAQVKTLETLNLNSDLKSIDGEKPQIQETSPRAMKSLPCLPKTNCARDVGGPQDNGMSQTQTSSCDMNNFLSSDKSSMLSFGSFGLGGVTVTQQQYFAQEAMDCTKALLEDENLGDYSIAMASDRMPTQE